MLVEPLGKGRPAGLPHGDAVEVLAPPAPATWYRPTRRVLPPPRLLIPHPYPPDRYKAGWLTRRHLNDDFPSGVRRRMTPANAAASTSPIPIDPFVAFPSAPSPLGIGNAARAGLGGSQPAKSPASTQNGALGGDVSGTAKE